jgi:hypothetical protein
MTPTRADVEAAVRAAFARSDTATIMSVIDLYGTQPYERERERVQLAVIGLSRGSEEKLLELVQVAKTDYRDVLSWADHGALSESEGQKQQERVRGLLEKWGKR